MSVEMEDQPQHYEPEEWPAEATPGFSETVRRPPEYSACMTWSIPQAGIGLPVQIAQRQPQRFKLKWVLTSLGGATSIVFNSKLDPVQGSAPQGATILVVGSLPDWESQQAIYVIAVGGGPATIAVWDETYALR